MEEWDEQWAEPEQSDDEQWAEPEQSDDEHWGESDTGNDDGTAHNDQFCDAMDWGIIQRPIHP